MYEISFIFFWEKMAVLFKMFGKFKGACDEAEINL